MSGRYASRLSMEERIAADVEVFRQEHFPDRSAMQVVTLTQPQPLYPPRVYQPSEEFLRKLRHPARRAT